MGHSYNYGMVTSSKGVTYEAVRVTGLNASPCVIEEDCKAGLISGVTTTVAGEYIFQMTAPYPPKLVVCFPQLSADATTEDILVARYKHNSYDSTTGRFTVLISNDDDAGAPVAGTPAAANELHVLMSFNRYNN
jgi:hypothetical protein